MKYDFDDYIERRSTASMKWDTYANGILPMWVADTDFRSPPQVAKAISDVVARGIFGYPIPDGSFEKAAANWMSTRFNWQIEPERVAWCPSMGTAIALCIQAFTNPGDGVAMLWPIYPPFINLCRFNGRAPRGSVLKRADGTWKIDFNELEAVFAKEDTRLFLLCSPHNPTGRVFTADELEKIGELCLKHNVLVFSDEIHGDIVYKGRQIPFPTISLELAAITLVGINASKTFNLADLRSGAVLSDNPGMLDIFIQAETSLKLGRCSLGIAGATAAWADCADYADQLVAYLKANAEYALKRIDAEWPEIKAYMPEATYLLWLDCRGLGMNNEALEKFFLEKARVALNNGATFGPGGEGFMRLNFGCPRSLLAEGIDRISKALADRG